MGQTAAVVRKIGARQRTRRAATPVQAHGRLYHGLPPRWAEVGAGLPYADFAVWRMSSAEGLSPTEDVLDALDAMPEVGMAYRLAATCPFSPDSGDLAYWARTPWLAEVVVRRPLLQAVMFAGRPARKPLDLRAWLEAAQVTDVWPVGREIEECERRQLHVARIIGDLTRHGTSRQVLNLVRSAAARRVHTEVLAVRGGPMEELLREAGAQVTVLGSVQALRDVLPAVLERADVVHLHYWGDDFGVLTDLEATGKLVVTSHCHGIRYLGTKAWSLTPYVNEETGPGAPTEIEIVSAVDWETIDAARMPRAEARAAEGLPADARVFVTVTKAVRIKGWNLWLDTVEALAAREPGACFVTIGPASWHTDWREYQERVAALRAAGIDLRTLADLPLEQVVRLMCAADVFLHTSYSEATPIAVREAARCRTPIVASDVGGTSQVVPEDAVLVGEPDAEAFARAARALLGTRGGELPWARFDLAMQAARHEEVYRMVVRDARARVRGREAQARSLHDGPFPRWHHLRDSVLPYWAGFPGPAEAPAAGEPLRVLYHCHVARQEGMECYADYLARAVPPGSVEWLYCVEHGAAHSGELLREHGEVRVLDIGAGQDGVWWQFLRAVLDFRPHLVHTATRAGAVMARACGLPVLSTVHGISGGRAYGADLADTAVAVSPAAQCADAPRAVLSGIAPVNWPQERRANTVALLGRLDDDRFPERFLDALALVPEARGVIIGRANRRDFDVDREAARRGIGERVAWLGHLSPQEARARVAECDLIVSCVDESFGFGTAEAMSAGVLPVVVDGPGYQAEMAREFGAVVPPTAAALAGAIRDLLADETREARRAPMAQAVAERYALSRVGAEYLALYRDLLAEPVDIMLVACGQAAITETCLRQILAHTWWPYRLVLVNNGGDADLATLFARTQAQVGAGRCIIVTSPTNVGCSAGRNLAYAACDAPFVAVIDNDMLVPPGWLGPLMAVMRSHEDCAAVAPWWEGYAEEWRGQEPRAQVFRGSNALYRRNFVAAAEETTGAMYCEPFVSLQGRSDTDLNWRLLEGGGELWIHGGVEFHHLGGPLYKSAGLTRRFGDRAGHHEADRLFDEKWAAAGVRRA